MPDLTTLGRYPYTGHTPLLGTIARPRQATGDVLGRFGGRPRPGRLPAFVAAGIPAGRRPELQGGGLLRSLGGWAAVPAQHRARELLSTDGRILGAGPFVEKVLREAAALPRAPRDPGGPADTAALGAAVSALFGGTQRRAAVKARPLLAYVWVEGLGRRACDLARALGQTRGNVSLATKRGAALAALAGADRDLVQVNI